MNVFAQDSEFHLMLYLLIWELLDIAEKHFT